MPTTNEMEAILPIPHITNVCIARRMLTDTPEHWLDDKIANVVLSFLPPNSIAFWPQKVKDIKSVYMDNLLKEAKNDAIGSI
jgi:hypothetical protein